MWDDALVEANAQNNQQAATQGRVISYTQALKEALSIMLETDPNVFVLGQGADDPGGMFGVSKGLKEIFGANRVFDTPVAEESMMGVCTGAAMTGMRPVFMHNRPDFILLAFNQLITHASKMHYMDNGKNCVPMVVWSAIGRGWGSGPQHTQAIHGLLIGIPGLKILMPSTPYDAKGLMISAIEDNNPVLIFEHRWQMKVQGEVPEGYYKVPIGKGIYRRRGKDLTIVGVSHTLDLAIKAIDELSKEGITADVIDLRSVKPLDEEIIFESLQKTGKILIVDTAWTTGGLCAEIGCLVAEKALQFLKAPVKRLGWPPTPSPAGFTLEQYFYPNVQKVIAAIRSTIQSEK